jgi:RNA polymerase sigma-70 factor, ECF subfamily
VITINHAASLSFAGSPEAALDLISPLLADPHLSSYTPLHALHADVLLRLGHPTSASLAYDRAITSTSNAVERAELERRRAAL